MRVHDQTRPPQMITVFLKMGLLFYAMFFVFLSGRITMSAETQELLITDFDRLGAANSWRVINDGVMGGVSSSTWNITDQDTAVFSGTVSLDNNGGFASVRSQVGTYNLSIYTGIVLRVRGDGKRYKLNLKTDAQFDSILYQAEFTTEKDNWQIIKLAFASFVPTYHGVVLSNAPGLDTAAVRTFGFLIADKQRGPFRLEIDWIKAYRD